MPVVENPKGMGLRRQRAAMSPDPNLPKNQKLSLMLIGGIGGYGGAKRTDLIKALRGSSDIKELHVVIAGPGGNVWDALVMHDLIASHPAKTFGYLVGEVASANTIFSSAFDWVVASKQMVYMFHKASNGTHGNADDHRHNADVLDKHDNRIADIYARRTGLPESLILELMSFDNWIEPEEALELGFIDEISDNIPFEYDAELLGENRRGYYDIYFQADAAEQARKNLRQRGLTPILNSAVLDLRNRANNSNSNSMNLWQKFIALFQAQKIDITEGKFMKGGVEITSDQLAELMQNELSEFLPNGESAAKMVQTEFANQLPVIQDTLASIVANNIQNAPTPEFIAAITAAVQGPLATSMESQFAAIRQEIANIKLGGTPPKPNNGIVPAPKPPASKAEPATPKTGDGSVMLNEMLAQGLISREDYEKHMEKAKVA